MVQEVSDYFVMDVTFLFHGRAEDTGDTTTGDPVPDLRLHPSHVCLCCTSINLWKEEQHLTILSTFHLIFVGVT